MPLSQSQLIAFNAISNFVSALGREFGTRQHSLALYARLIEHTTLSHEPAIVKHVEGFSKYIAANQSAIEESNESKLTSDKVEYSDRIFINLKPLFEAADVETKAVMWKHLLTIYGVLYPDSQAKEILRKMNTNVKSAEGDLIQTMVQKITPHLNPEETNPMQAIMGLMSSGVFTDLISTMQKGMDDGSIDVNNLLKNATGMFAGGSPTDKLIDEQK